jgi:MFS family permease
MNPAAHRPRFLPWSAVALGLVSLLNDMSGEMLAPVIPVFLTATLGAGPAIVGLIEGLAQSSVSFLKLAAGIAVDRGVRPKRLMLIGYGLANTVRPLIGLAGSWGVVLALRVADRIGKGLRGAPRDALLAASVAPERMGRAFGFHRAMDYVGSTLGPALGALLLLSGLPMRGLFLAAAIPGIALMGLIVVGVSNRRLDHPPAARRPLAWSALPLRLKALLTAAAVLAVAGVQDAFLVLWVATRVEGLADVLLVFAGVNAARAVVAMFGGELSDRAGTLPTILIGWTLRVGLLLALALAADGAGTGVAVGLVVALTAAMAWSAPAELALLSHAAPTGRRGALLGTYHMLTGLLTLPGAVLFGWLWQRFGMSVAFLGAAAGTAVAAAALLLAMPRRKSTLSADGDRTGSF